MTILSQTHTSIHIHNLILVHIHIRIMHIHLFLISDCHLGSQSFNSIKFFYCREQCPLNSACFAHTLVLFIQFNQLLYVKSFPHSVNQVKRIIHDLPLYVHTDCTLFRNFLRERENPYLDHQKDLHHTIFKSSLSKQINLILSPHNSLIPLLTVIFDTANHLNLFSDTFIQDILWHKKQTSRATMLCPDLSKEYSLGSNVALNFCFVKIA